MARRVGILILLGLTLVLMGRVAFKRVSQGVVIVIVGAGILIAGVYFLPAKQSERQLKGKEITIEREDGKERTILRR